MSSRSRNVPATTRLRHFRFGGLRRPRCDPPVRPVTGEDAEGVEGRRERDGRHRHIPRWRLLDGGRPDGQHVHIPEDVHGVPYNRRREVIRRRRVRSGGDGDPGGGPGPRRTHPQAYISRRVSLTINSKIKYSCVHKGKLGKSY